MRGNFGAMPPGSYRKTKHWVPIGTPARLGDLSGYHRVVQKGMRDQEQKEIDKAHQRVIEAKARLRALYEKD